MKEARILIIDDEAGVRNTFSAFLAKEGYKASTASDYREATEALASSTFDLVLTDIILGSHSGIDVLKEIRAHDLPCPVIMMTGAPDVETAAASVRLGAFDYIPKPIGRDTLLRVARHALRHKALLDEKRGIESEKERYRIHIEAVFHSVKDAIITVDDDRRIIQANEACEKICGMRVGQATGMPSQAVSNECSGMCFDVLKQAVDQRCSIHEYRIECSHSRKPHQSVVLNISPLRDGRGRQIGAVMVMRDITRLSLLEKELRDRHRFHNIIGRSRQMQEIYDLLDNLKDIDTTVLITGPSGTGKELVARAVHFGGNRSARPFVVVNCSALAENLLESELFGHVKGSFTGAVKDKTGRFQTADKGSIFLDEIGDISPKIQLKLLRFLETKEFERVGDNTPIRLDVQVITATNRNLRELVAGGEFREDLYYRLKVLEIKLPPLRERSDDIPMLVSHYVGVFNERFNKHILGVSKDVEKIFMEYRWPGNIRELIHALERAFVVCRSPVIDVGDLPPEMRDHAAETDAVTSPGTSEKAVIENALARAGGNKARAARLLGVSRQTVYRWIEKHGISVPSSYM